MASSTDDLREPEAILIEEPREAITNHEESDRTEEVPALLGGSIIPDIEEADIAIDPGAEGETIATTQSESLAEEKSSFSTTDPFHNQPDLKETEQQMLGLELKKVQESLHDSLTTSHSISVKIDAITNDTESLLNQIKSLSLNYELLTAEMESISSGTNAKSTLSKIVLTIASLLLTLLVVFQAYTFITLINTQQNQSAAETSVLKNISSLNNKMAAYDKNLTKALERPAPQEHLQAKPVATDVSSHDTSVHNEAPPPHGAPVPERLNRLRNGLQEKKLIRKETGDWFVYNKKGEECVSDVEIIETLNLAYKKIGRSLTTTVPLPAHNALCILKPDGKGGTEVVMTKVFVP